MPTSYEPRAPASPSARRNARPVDPANKDVNVVFGRRLAALRHGHGLTQIALATRSSVSVDAVRRLEHGRYSPTLETMTKLARGLGCPLTSLLDFGSEQGHDADAAVHELLAHRSRHEVELALRILRSVFEPER